MAVQADRDASRRCRRSSAPSSARATPRGSRCPCARAGARSITMSCSALALASALAQARGRVGLARRAARRHVLRVGVEARDGDADVAVQHVAALDDRIVAELRRGRSLALHSTLGWNQVPRPRSLTRWRHHQTRSLVFVSPGVIVFDENISCVIDHTSSCIFGRTPLLRAGATRSARAAALRRP